MRTLLARSRRPRSSPAAGRSYWQRHGGAPVEAPTAEDGVPKRADFVIVGGGLAGLMTAIRLVDAEPAADVVVLEAAFVGHGASGRNGGLMSPLAAPIWLASADHNREHAWAITTLNSRTRQAAEWLEAEVAGSEVARTVLRLERGRPHHGSRARPDRAYAVARGARAQLRGELGRSTAAGPRECQPIRSIPIAPLPAWRRPPMPAGCSVHEGVRVGAYQRGRGRRGGAARGWAGDRGQGRGGVDQRLHLIVSSILAGCGPRASSTTCWRRRRSRRSCGHGCHWTCRSWWSSTRPTCSTGCTPAGCCSGASTSSGRRRRTTSPCRRTSWLGSRPIWSRASPGRGCRSRKPGAGNST